MIRSSMSSIPSGEWERIFGRKCVGPGGRADRPALNPRDLFPCNAPIMVICHRLGIDPTKITLPQLEKIAEGIK